MRSLTISSPKPSAGFGMPDPHPGAAARGETMGDAGQGQANRQPQSALSHHLWRVPSALVPVLALIAAAIVLVACAEKEKAEGVDGEPVAGGNGDGSPWFQEARASRADAPSECCRRVTGVIDGDTIKVSTVGVVRLIGVDTPERGRCGYATATRFTERQLSAKRVRLEYDTIRVDPYRRVLAYVYEGGRMHDLVLARRGYAEASTFPLIDRYALAFEAAERKARSNGQRIWEACGGP
jgi:endonuclease YncB( thermonuclease family)